MWSEPSLFARQLSGNASTTIGEAVFSVLRGPCRDYVTETILKEGAEPREWGYSGVQRSKTETRELELGVQKLYDKVRGRELSQLSVGNSHGKLVVVEEELEVSL
jgi:hypothetical protein